MAELNDSLYSQFQQYIRKENVDYYAKLESELQSLSEDDINELMKFPPYIEKNNILANQVQQELFLLVRNRINAYPNIIEDVVGAVKAFKSQKQKTHKEFMANFEDYIKNFSDMPYNDYLKLKNG